MSDMTDDIEALRREIEQLQTENAQLLEQLRLANVDAALEEAEANTVREACNQRTFRLEAEVERLRDELRQSSIDYTRAEVLADYGYRRCAVNQRTTQFCGLLEAAVKAEREACARICEDAAQRWRDAGWDDYSMLLKDAAHQLRLRNPP